MIRIFELFLLQYFLTHRQQKCHMLKKATRKGVSQFKTDLGVSQVEKTCKQRAPANKELIQARNGKKQRGSASRRRHQEIVLTCKARLPAIRNKKCSLQVWQDLKTAFSRTNYEQLAVRQLLVSCESAANQPSVRLQRPSRRRECHCKQERASSYAQQCIRGHQSLYAMPPLQE